MHRFGILCFNIMIAVDGATAYTWAVRRGGMNMAACTRALLEGGSAGLLAGVTVGLGATLGPGPELFLRKCVLAQMGIAVSSLVGRLIAYYFPHVWSTFSGVIDEALAERGILRGSGVGLFIATAIHVIEIYIKRRESSQ